tara:strand:- start:221 stop:613 length:393 start_codon:yes stop_codon:yes gene_type:complete
MEKVVVHHESSAVAAKLAARLEANDKGGKDYWNGASPSMAPAILPYDAIVAMPTPYADLKVGMVCNYYASWNLDANGKPKLTCHRIVAVWPDGSFLMEGDAPKEQNTAETKSKMDAKNYVDRVVSVYRFP